MNRLVLTFGLILAFNTVAQAQIDRVPENTINCADFRKIDASTWVTTRLAHFDIGNMKGNGLPPNIPLQRGIFNLEEIDLVDVLDARCAGYAIKGIQLNGSSDEVFQNSPPREDHSREDIYEKHQPEPTSLNSRDQPRISGLTTTSL